MIYVIELDSPDKPIKIGYTKNMDTLQRRMRAYATHSAYKPVLRGALINGTPTAEAQLHAALFNHRMKSGGQEWYRSQAMPVKMVVKWIENNPTGSWRDLVRLAQEAAGQPVTVTKKPLRKMDRAARKRRKRAMIQEQIKAGEIKVTGLDRPDLDVQH